MTPARGARLASHSQQEGEKERGEGASVTIHRETVVETRKAPSPRGKWSVPRFDSRNKIHHRLERNPRDAIQRDVSIRIRPGIDDASMKL